MARTFLVSTIIPTYNRVDLVQRAIDSALAQTRPVDEIIVVDDGSTDGTGDVLRSRYGDAIRYHWQANAGVSAARNLGMSLARGDYFALLDSDDVWLPDKTRMQAAYLDAHPHIGMVLCDVSRVDGDGAPIDVFRRRDAIPRDGWVLADVLMNPALAPASAMFRRAVYAQTGGFDTTLRTAEDIDFHLRVARHWQIGVVETTLVEAMRGHDGLSAEPGTYDDYVRVVERAVADCAGVVDDAVRNRALAATYTRNARGMLIGRRWSGAWRLARRAWTVAPDAEARRALLGLAAFAMRRAAATAMGR